MKPPENLELGHSMGISKEIEHAVIAIETTKIARLTRRFTNHHSHIENVIF